MIVKFSGSGSSFTGVSKYLTHDPNALTSERVEFTHTFNLASDFVPAAVNEMYWTSRDAEIYKREAGIRAGGRSSEHPAKHLSLNWAPEDSPSQEHMIRTGEHFLRTMNWGEHQAIFVAHNDKKYKHLHILVNEIHPDTGLTLDDGFERRRAQKWAAEYEREQGIIRCPQRLLNPEQREKAMPRNMWLEFQKNELEFEKSERQLIQYFGDFTKWHEHRQWEIFKGIQRKERDQFFTDGAIEYKEVRNAAYREVREEFRERWGDYYRAKKNSTGEMDERQLEKVKEQIEADQKAVLGPQRDAACAELREDRDKRYEDLKERHRNDRAEFRERLQTGIDNAPFFYELSERANRVSAVSMAFRDAAQEATHDFRPPDQHSPWFIEGEDARDYRVSRSRSQFQQALDAGPAKVAVGVGSLLDSLFFDLTTLGSAQPEPMPASERSEIFREAAENTTKQQQDQVRVKEDEDWRERQKSLTRD
jgi:hypothetical protein